MKVNMLRWCCKVRSCACECGDVIGAQKALPHPLTAVVRGGLAEEPAFEARILMEE